MYTLYSYKHISFSGKECVICSGEEEKSLHYVMKKIFTRHYLRIECFCTLVHEYHILRAESDRLIFLPQTDFLQI